MPVPKRKTGKAKRNMRRSHHALEKPNLTECQNCGEKVVQHRVCPTCGYYHTKSYSRAVVPAEED